MPKNYAIMRNMVRLINKKNKHKVADVVQKVLKFQELFTKVIEINNPGISPCIYALWHGNQFAIYGIADKANVNVLISNSADGQIITKAVEGFGFKVVRGSTARRGCVSSTMQLISRLKSGECAAIMVDGPQGPLHKVKGGAIKLAKETGAPIIPLHWYSAEKTFIRIPSWDKMTTPLGLCHLINLYGEPIYVGENDDEQEVAEKIKLSLENLEKIAPDEFKKAKKLKLWKKKR